MNYDEAMNYIQNTAKFGKRNGLERIHQILDKLGKPHQKLKCIHVAGTNGKGSTTAMISRILKTQGYRVGMYTSPYLEEFEERIQIDGINIPKERLCEIVSRVSKAVDRVIAEGYDPPTEFEIITASMYLFFHEENVDFAVIEVGLGGRFDPTNVITPLVSVITSISYDHMAILGNSLGEIAFEKAGIIKALVPVVSYPQKEEAAKVIQRVAIEKSCNITFVEEGCGSLIGIEGKYQRVRISTKAKEYEVQLALLGEVQIYNCAVAINTVETLIKLGFEVSLEAIHKGLKEVQWRGRMEVLNIKPYVLLDGAHNIDGMERLSISIDTYFKYKKLYVIIGMLADKQVEDMLRIITPKAERVIAVTPNTARAEHAEALREKILNFNYHCEAYGDYAQAFKYAVSLCSEQDLLVICGSLYMIGDMRRIIKKIL